ncbi:hypothetical protein AMS68_001992 [Peltaster fructicola]|uniref:DUF3752 domain-containing protein n=1 Tax=Peltaster fructicola TaxID=286661 RepID=A0A6H0XPB6_9PEZI|nr:hypothetical protein AMS68_001992 [Peltaster fructicola]
MSDIGPSLPPHLLAKRKRQQEEQNNDASSTTPGARPETTSETSEKRRRVVGPAMPPASLEERPTRSADADDSGSSDDDDDLGPALPTSDHDADAQQIEDDRPGKDSEALTAPEKLRRDDWMTMAPAQDDLAARMDPTKIRARGFNTGRAARGGGGQGTSGMSAWNETAEQRKKRLADEVLGITSGSTEKEHVPRTTMVKAEQDERTAQKLRENMEKTRGPSLLEKHRQDKPEKVDDDPSKRAFDREKDMGHASRISGTQKRDMISKASGYSSRFSGGSYL